MVLKEQMVAEKDHSLPRAKDFLTPLLMKGRRLRADALFTQHTMCHEVIACGGHSLLFIQNNQPTLRQDVSLFFEEPPHDWLHWRTASTTNKGHGRLAHRRLTASTELNDFLARDWYGVGQVCRLRRRVEHAFTWTQEIVYGMTSLTPKQADASRLLALARGHWSIENCLQYRWDGSLGEDACQVRKGSAPHTLDVLNSFVLALFDFCQVANAKQFMRLVDTQPLRAIRLLLASLTENEIALQRCTEGLKVSNKGAILEEIEHSV